MNAAPLALNTSNHSQYLKIGFAERHRRGLNKAWGIAPGTPIQLINKR
jgi:hypothetical protein